MVKKIIHLFMHFFTATINNWQRLLADDALKDIIIGALQDMHTKGRAHTHAFVVMPNHIHLVWSRGQGYEIALAEHDLLRFTAHTIKKYLQQTKPSVLSNYVSTQADRQFHFWERRSRTIEIMSCEIAVQKINYVHSNPIQEKWGLAALPEDYKYSSAAFYYKGDTSFPFLTHFMDYI